MERTLAILFVIHLALCWIICYPRGDLDDKAVHYYSAARLYASRPHIAAVNTARPDWLCQLPNQALQFRTANRLASYANYPLPSSILRIVMQLDQAHNGWPPHSYVRPLKIAFLILHVFALLWLLAVTWRQPLIAVVLLTIFSMAALWWRLNWLAPLPRKDMMFLIYVPRGSAILIWAACFAAAYQKRWWSAVISFILLLAWNVGAALLVLLPTLGALVWIGTIPTAPRSPKFLLLGCLLFVGASGSLIASAEDILRLWIPLATLGALMWWRRAAHANLWLRALQIAAAFLVGVRLIIILSSRPDISAWLTGITGNQLIAELPLRLAGATHVASLAFVLTGTIAALNILFGNRVAMVHQRRAAHVMAGLFFLYVAQAHWNDTYRVWHRHGRFFRTEDAHVARLMTNPQTLKDLNPRRESEFFASLGDFFLRPISAQK